MGAYPYPTIIPGPAPQPNATSGPPSQHVLRTRVPGDKTIFGAAVLNPAIASHFIAGRFQPEWGVPGDYVPNKGVPPAGVAGVRPDAQTGNVAAFKDPPPAPFREKKGPNPSTAKVPWLKRYIPPINLHDASQWVSQLFFVRAMPAFGADTSDPPLRAQYFTPPPIETNNLGAGTLNLQLQLGQLKIQAAQLTMAASNYHG